MGINMFARTFERSQAEPVPFSLPVGARTSLLARFDVHEEVTESISADPPVASGCLRGFCWAMGIEGAAGLLFFLLWHLA